MINKLDEFKLKIDSLCKNITYIFPLQKIYINESNDTILNLLFIPHDKIKDHDRFLNYNEDILLGFISLKQEYDIKDLYIELDFNIVSLIDLPTKNIITDYFSFIENNKLTIKFLESKIKNYNENTIQELIRFICLFTPKKAMKIIQYMIYNKIFDFFILKKVYDGYTEILENEHSFYSFNNIGYVRKAVLSCFSLDNLKIELVYYL